MTDQELIDLLAQKAPEELSPEEIDLLRARLAESAELREVLLGQLQMESYLAAALGPAAVSVDDVYRRARQERTRGDNPLQAVIIVVASVVLIFLVLAVFVGAWLAGTGTEKKPLV